MKVLLLVLLQRLLLAVEKAVLFRLLLGNFCRRDWEGREKECGEGGDKREGEGEEEGTRGERGGGQEREEETRERIKIEEKEWIYKDLLLIHIALWISALISSV